ncbi:MAG: Eco57I restriction-modification methylase domain-containing protein [Myxococcales bacterium]|nr:Eco57I restriction-modification methylase domain-containing protein [Myxococcales bacterium]
MTNLEFPIDLGRSDEVAASIELLAQGEGERGAVFTRAAVVDAILDLAGYTTDRPLHTLRLLEPSFGDGEFLLAAIDRLLTAFVRFGGRLAQASQVLAPAVRGVELHAPTFEATCSAVRRQLIDGGLPVAVADSLVATWFQQDDFLLSTLDGSFDFVVGNPPYVRQERIPDPLLRAYRQRFTTLYDRADLYVLFFERGLDLLARGGTLGFICANRWMKNKYGGPLRQKIAEGFGLRYFIDLERADVFREEVLAYPAITVITRGATKPTLAIIDQRDDPSGLPGAVAALRAASDGASAHGVASLTGVAQGTDPWLLDAPEVLAPLRRLEADFPTLEQAGAQVGIGVATGADKVFIGLHADLPVEPERKLRLAMAADCQLTELAWGGQGVVNPFLPTGQLASFQEFPSFGHYLDAHGETLRRRHVARKQPGSWYRTIDRIDPALTARPKLLIPDIKGRAVIAYDSGTCYPHHNLYVITSETWNLRALQALLRSSVALMFVAAYGVRMSGGFLRFQAQYLRRIRVPSGLSAREISALEAVATTPDQGRLDAVVRPLYRLTDDEAAAIETIAAAARVGR